jgi:nicotinamide-nucleotide amidase
LNAEIINVGTELLIGDQVSSNQNFLVTELANIDINVYCQNTAGFSPDRLKDLLSIALMRSDIILIVGGMGPNAEDIAKQTVCSALGIGTVHHDVSAKRIDEYCSQNGLEVTDLVMSMADMPVGAVVFRNDSGMCPGCAIRSSNQCVVMLPSSTVELVPMVRNYVIQYLKLLTDGAVFSQIINIFSSGITLHEVEERLGGLKDNRNPTIKCVEMTGEVQIRVTAKTDDEEQARNLAAPVIKQILNIFGSDAYGMNCSGLEEIVVRELRDHRMTISTAESCTAGIISKRITDISGASRVFEMGASTYSSNKKSDMLGVSNTVIQRFGAVSPEAAVAMAVGARRLAGSTVAVSTTGIAGPGGGTPQKPVGLVYIALADKERVWVKKVLINKPGMDRDYVRFVASSHALNLVRIYVETLPNLMPGYEVLGEDVRESYFDDATSHLSPQAYRNAAVAVPAAGAASSATKKKPSSKSGKKKNMSNSKKSSRSSKKSSSSPVQLAVFWLALLVFVGSGGYLLYDSVYLPMVSEGNYTEYRENYSDDAVTNAADNGIWTSIETYDPERAEDGTLKSFGNLLAINKDVVGWIKVPNTIIDYPVVQGTDNDYYLKHDINRKSDKNGTIFADYKCVFSLETPPKNTILYGHHMRSGVMFENLLKYDKVDFYRQNPVIRFNSKYQEGEWVIFSIMKINTLKEHGEPFNFMRTDFAGDEDFLNYVEEIRLRSTIETRAQIDILPTDEILTLSTCSYEYSDFRTVLVARKIREGESLIDVSGVVKATNPLMPKVWKRAI